MADIEVSENGPFGVHGLELVRLRYNAADDSREQEWVERFPIDVSERADERGTYWLCRCGQSADKPFCDGSHRGGRPGTEPFDGREHALTSSYRERATIWEGPGGVVRGGAKLCSHAGFCTADGSGPWDMVKSDDAHTHAAMRTMVDHCPSGTLTRAESVDDHDIEHDLPLRVAIVDDGPIFVTGGASVRGTAGIDYEVRNRITLCRCGRSGQMPFCDGTHEEIGFADS